MRFTDIPRILGFAFALVSVPTALSVWFHVFWQWLQLLDSTLDAQFFMTVAGLSLAAAAFLYGSRDQAMRTIADLDKEVDTIGGMAKKYCLDDLQRAEKELDEAEKRGNLVATLSYTPTVATYMIARHRLREAKLRADALKLAQRRLTDSFYIFVVGLVLSLTVDLWAEAGMGTVAEDTGSTLHQLTSIVQNVPSVVLDSMSALLVLTIGLHSLIAGSVALVQQGHGDVNSR